MKFSLITPVHRYADTLFELYESKTIVFISHEDKILKKFNRIFYLENKKLIEK